MKLSLIALALFVMAALPQAFAADEKEMMHKDATIKAVVFHSDNCGSCKILAPRVEEAMNAVNTDKIDVVKFDFTTNESGAEAAALAKSKNVESVLQQFGSKTGFISIVNGQGEIVDKLTKNDTAEDIAAKLAKAIVSAS